MKRNNDEFHYEVIAINEYSHKEKLRHDINYD